MQNLLVEIYRRNNVLAVTGWINVAIFVAALVLAFFDSRTILGINPWIKPMKFAISITIYVWTLGWLLEYVREWKRTWTFITWGTAIAQITEIVLIAIQSARGTPSHFNETSVLNGIIFSVMGLMIFFSTLLDVVLLVLFLKKNDRLHAAFLWGIRFGLLIFIVGSGVGGQMVGNMAHTVGAPDGGPGLPFVNWSTVAGDLRIAHALGLHALQFLPLIGFAISKSHMAGGYQRSTMLLISVVYAAGVVALYMQAMDGMPMIALE